MNLGADVTRIWEYREDPSQVECVRIVLRHNPVTKVIALSVGGNELSPGMLDFGLPNGYSGRVVIDAVNKSFFSRLGTFKYYCFVNGKGAPEVQLKESNELMKELDDGVTSAEVQIPVVVVDGNKVVWYQIRCKIVRIYKDTPPQTMYFAVHRRFRDFYFCYKQILTAFRGTHMLSSIPKHPPRHAKFLEDHLRPEFLETRRVELENWLRRTLLVPRVGINPDVEAFLGMGDPSMREVSVVITQGSSLGLRLKKRHGPLVPGSTDRYENVFPQAIVVDYMRGEDGKKGVAEESGLIGVGDVISKINGESVVNACYEEIVPRLKNSPRPLVVHFLGYNFAQAGTISGGGKPPTQQQDQTESPKKEEAQQQQRHQEDTVLEDEVEIDHGEDDDVDEEEGTFISNEVVSEPVVESKRPAPTQAPPQAKEAAVESKAPVEQERPKKPVAKKEPALFQEDESDEEKDIFAAPKTKEAPPPRPPKRQQSQNKPDSPVATEEAAAQPKAEPDTTSALTAEPKEQEVDLLGIGGDDDVDTESSLKKQSGEGDEEDLLRLGNAESSSNGIDDSYNDDDLLEDVSF